MLISYFILLTATSAVVFLPRLGFAIPTHAHTRVHGHGHGHGQRHGHTHATHYDLPTAEELALPLAKRNHQCTSMFQRKAWHVLTSEEKKEYIKAEQCLMKLPSKSGLAHAKSRFDDLQAVHQLQGDIVHLTGYFLPFHRLIIHAHEALLRTECNFTGTQPYWEETLEAGDFSSSAIFSTTEGFGGNGNPSTGVVEWFLGDTKHSAGCITDGPFKDYRLHIGPGMNNWEHCISREINNVASRGSSSEYVQECMENDSFATAWPCIETNPHTGGHRGVGGEMFNPYSSPGDPLFYLHHAWVDKVWWDWQKADLANRVRDITGRKRMGDRNGREGMVTLGDTLKMMGVVPDAKVGEVMDLNGKRLCVEYI